MDIEIADYPISSDVAGHARVDRGEYEIAYVVVRAAEAVDWNDVHSAIEARKHKKISVFFESFTRNHTAERLEKRVAELEERMEQILSLVEQGSMALDERASAERRDSNLLASVSE